MPPPETQRPSQAPKPSQEPQKAPQGDPRPRDDESPAPEPQKAPTASQEAEKPKRFDETVPGGKYEVGGKMVDADGKPLNEKK